MNINVTSLVYTDKRCAI